eukprot:504386-Prorocentrum_minimum.AAC.2
MFERLLNGGRTVNRFDAQWSGPRTAGPPPARGAPPEAAPCLGRDRKCPPCPPGGCRTTRAGAPPPPATGRLRRGVTYEGCYGVECCGGVER